MATKKKPQTAETENALVPVPEGHISFPVVMATTLELDEALAAEIDDTDNEGYEDVIPSLPFAGIRQKEVKDKAGKITMPAGNFRIKDRVNPDIPDANGSIGLTVTILRDQFTRVYWENLTDEKPTCKSNDGRRGIGDPGGWCLNCKLNEWDKDGNRPDCAQHVNLLCLDHSNQMIYVLNLGRSALRPYNDFKSYLKAQKVNIGGKPRSIPPHFMKVRVTTKYNPDPQPHYIPEFWLVDILSQEMVAIAKDHRADTARFSSTIDQLDTREDDASGDNEHSELPGGVTPVSQGEPEIDPELGF